jgi:chloramphenicol 3-O phosphotransferase
MPPTLILLNGVTSSGKSSLLRALQKRLSEPFLEAGIDKFIFMLPERYLDDPYWDDVLGQASRAGAHGMRLFGGMHAAIEGLLRTGNNVLADHVLIEPAWAADCAARFGDMRAYLIGVRCSLEVIEARERARGDRTPGQARKQFEAAHAYCVYDFEVDTSHELPDACAERVLAFLATGAPPRALREMRGGSRL